MKVDKRKLVKATRLYEIDPNKKYVVFLNVAMIDGIPFCQNSKEIPPETTVHFVYPSSGQTMDDAIRIYEVE